MDTSSLIRFAGTDFDTLLPSQQEMAAIDRKTIEAGVSSSDLMERAGEHIAASAVPYVAEKGVIFLCGPGNNGGDGLVAARLLHNKGLSVIILTAHSEAYSTEFMSQLKKCLDLKLRIVSLKNSSEFETEILSDEAAALLIKESSLIVDCLLGTGQDSAPRGGILSVLNLLPNDQSDDRFVLSADIPTGLNADTGEVYDKHVTADMTVCIELVKKGLLQYPARLYCGMLMCRSIDLDLTETSAKYQVNAPTVPSFVTHRNPASHKGSFGSVLVIGGSENMPGAPVLAALAALHMGSGAVRLVDIGQFSSVLTAPELMRVCLEPKASCFSKEHAEHLSSEIEKASTVVLGCGLGTGPAVKEFVLEVIKLCLKYGTKTVIDADALNAVSEEASVLKSLTSNFILTPHPGEMGRLLSCTSEEVQKDRYAAADLLNSKSEGVLVLKGASSIISRKDLGFVNLSGTPYMAVPGSGDVLSGVLAALCGLGLEPIQAASLGVFLHGLAGERASTAVGDRTILATELIAELRNTLASYSEHSRQ